MAVVVRVVGVLVTLSIVVGCRSAQPLALPPGLTVPDDARGVAASQRGRAYDVTFVVSRLYPAEGLIAELGANVVRAGFEPLKDDWLNPGGF